jgi:gliding motility-associated lipoprotein GldH
MEQHSPTLVTMLAVLVLTAACSDDRVVFEQNIEISDALWAVSERAVLTYDALDTVTQHNFLINVRNTEAYPYRNLYLFLKTTFPNGKTSRDTIGLFLADATGKWLGTGTGYLNSGRYPGARVMYAYNKRFPAEGEYVFEIEHAMRVDTLVGIRNIGMRIEKMPAAE